MPITTALDVRQKRAADPPQNPIWNTTLYSTPTPSVAPTIFATVWIMPSPGGIIVGGDHETNVSVPKGSHESFKGVDFRVADDDNRFTAMLQPPVEVPMFSAISTSPITSMTNGSTQTFGHQTGPVSTASTLSNATSNRTSSSDGLSSGAVAGVAIGCLVAGALIAGALAWFCLKRRKPKGGNDSEASTIALMHNEKGARANNTSLSTGSPSTGGMEGLPQPLEDKAISGEVSKISNLIKNHVQSYYHTGRVSPGSVDYDDIQALGPELPVSVGTLSTLLSNSATREIALRFCIAWVIIPRMQITDSPRTTFLPPEVSECFQGMSLVDRGSQVHAMFFAKWRAITAELMQSTYVRNPFSSSDLRLQNIHEAANVLDNVLRPYSDSRMEDVQRTRNLEEILKRAALFAFSLFSQPSTWDFDWENEQGVKSGSLCIFPSLVQVADEKGEPVKPPRPFSEAVVRRLDE